MIPKYFDLMGHAIEVRQVKVPPGIKDEIDSHATWQKDKQLITINVFGQSETLLHHTYLHEVTHAILDAMGKEDLSKDEEFVDMFSGLLHQVLTTGRDE